MTLPNTLIVGMGRSGTTALVRALNSHPDVWFVSNRVKIEMKDEIKHNDMHFFSWDSRYEKGLGWYSKFFKAGANYKIIGEKTPSYFNDPAVSRIRKDLGPDIKIILCVREPIDRSYSQWAHLNQKGMYYGEFWDNEYKGVPFEQCIRSDINKYSDNNKLEWNKDKPHWESQLLHNSNYYYTVNKLYSLWGKKQVHVVVSEALRSRPQNEYNKLTDWLGLNRHKLPEYTQKPTNCSTFKKIASQSGDHITESEYWNQENYKETLYNNIDAETALTMREYFSPMKQEFCRLINRKIKEWE